MVTYEELYEKVKSEVSEKRFNHILGVIKRTEEYASVYPVNLEEAKIAALLHDVAKEYSQEKSYEILEKYGYQLDKIEENNDNLIHGKVAGVIAKYEYGLSENIVNAISFHTTGRENMSMLEKVIYLADATEPGRVYKDGSNKLTVEETVSLVKKDIDAGMLYVLKWNLESLLRKGLLIHLDSVKAYNFYKKYQNM